MATSNQMRVVLIGGSSNVGKSTLGQALAAKLGWDYRSTDKLARHPGFPWVGDDGLPRPADVLEHYCTLNVDELLADVLAHYKKNVIPQVNTLVRDYHSDPTLAGLVLEGSALWPEFVADLVDEAKVKALWLTASDSLFRDRIYSRSRFEQSSAAEKFLIQQFLDRTLLYNQSMRDELERLRFPVLEVESVRTPDELLNRSLAGLGLRD